MPIFNLLKLKLNGNKTIFGKITDKIISAATAAAIFFDLKVTKIPPFFTIKIFVLYIIQHIFCFVNNLS